MKKLISKSKLNKKAMKALNEKKCVTWGFTPVTRRVESGKRYKRASQGDKKRWEREAP
ncbi:MAG: hypothetical protein ACOX6O_06140 [Christensenellales bacterium]|jgi:hypothetical protein